MFLLRPLVAYATPIMLAGVVVGLFVPPLAATARPFLPVLIATTLAIAIMRTDLRTLTSTLAQPAMPTLHVVWLLILSPLLMYAALLVLPVPDALVGPLVLFAAAAPITSMPAFALLFGLSANFVLIGVTAAALLSPLTVPVVAALVMGDRIEIGAGALGLRMALLIGSGFAVGIVLRRVFGAARIEGWKLRLDALFVVTATLLGISIMDGVLDLAAARPHALAVTVAAVFASSFALMALGTLAFLPAGLTTALGAGLNSGPRSISVVLAVVGAAASEELIMTVAAAQLPIFVFPLFQRPLFRWLLGRRAAAAVPQRR